jgi:co-chaperonin GroES (HSP10)
MVKIFGKNVLLRVEPVEKMDILKDAPPELTKDLPSEARTAFKMIELMARMDLKRMGDAVEVGECCKKIKQGSKIMFKSSKCHDFKVGDSHFLIINEDDKQIMAILPPESIVKE